MQRNVLREDLDSLIDYLKQDDPFLTQANQVLAFEREWAKWLGVRYAVLVNSGSSANLLTMAAVRHTRGAGDVIVPTLTWVSDIASVIQNDLAPVFVDIDPRTLGADTDQVLGKITPRTRAVFLTHILGYNALSSGLLDGLRERGIPLVEDACESHGATFAGRKVGTFGLLSNFSFYYAHHMTTGEGGMVCTDDADLYEVVRMLRSHGMVREATSEAVREGYRRRHPDLEPDFIFAYPAYNVRSTELAAVIGRSQLRRLDANIEIRNRNLAVFLESLDPSKYFTEFDTRGCSNYAFTLVLRHPDRELAQRVMRLLRESGVEFRRGLSGGGNQLRQPYLEAYRKRIDLADFPNVDHVHFHGFYIGNSPEIETESVRALCTALNELRCG